MLQGPPSTGKMTMLVTLISILGCLQWRTLLSAPINVVVIEVYKRMMSFFTVESKKEENLKFQQEMLSGFCSRVRDSQDRTKPIELCDVILVGSLGSRMERAVKSNLLQLRSTAIEGGFKSEKWMEKLCSVRADAFDRCTGLLCEVKAGTTEGRYI